MAQVLTPLGFMAGYLVVLQSQLRSRMLVLRFPGGRHSDILSPSAVADRCSDTAGSDRDAPPPGTPLWPFSGGASSVLHTALP